MAEKHKKFLERYRLFPLVFHYQEDHIQFISYYRVVNEIYSGLLFYPVDLPAETMRECFYYFYRMDMHLYDGMKIHNDFASKDYSAGYYRYRDLLDQQLKADGELESIRPDLQFCVYAINRIEEYLSEIRDIYQHYKHLLKLLKERGNFSVEDLNQLNDYGAEILYRVYKQGEEQLSLLDPIETIIEKSARVKSVNGDLKDIFEISRLMLEPKSVATLKNSQYGFTKDITSHLSKEEIKHLLIEREIKKIKKAYNTGCLNRKIRNFIKE
ncbi:hypothetical protein [Bacillus sp. 1P06AnD]|uniref:hypothetical protein n=1 Tax=Bacillus sp. 1P06AnD TaxID=3132208 RepID=UPI00399F70BC